MTRTWWAWARLLGGAAILAVLVLRLGTGPFLHGVRTVDARSVAAAGGLAVVTTVCGAWRWTLIARGLGVGMSLRAAVAACYRSQFLNTTLPGGVLGDVDRALRSGRDAGDVGGAVRAVAWERGAGQVVQIALAAAVLLLVPSPARAELALPGAVLLAVALGGGVSVVLVARTLRGRAGGLWARIRGTVVADVRDGLLAGRAWAGILVASVLCVAAHVATFLVAARAADSTVSPLRLLPLALLVLVAAGLPTNVAGWGPREGVAAWAFGVAGLHAADGLAIAVVYGVLVLVAGLPGAVVLVATTCRRSRAPVSARGAEPVHG
jgi:uncharacterized membrane protein YbhN (UPF0104 family)